MVLNRVALTGASGMLARYLLPLLARQKLGGVVTSRTGPSNLPDRFNWRRWDLAERRTFAELDELYGQVDAVLHLGASLEAVPALHEINVSSVTDLGKWAAAAGIPIVFISSSTVYRDPTASGIEEENARLSVGGDRCMTYPESKVLAEAALNDMTTTLGLRAIILRPSSLYGIGLPPDKMIPRLLDLARSGRRIQLSAPTEDRVNLVHASDVAAAMISALQQEAWGTFNIAGTHPITIREIAEMCVSIAGGRASVATKSTDIRREPVTRFDLCCGAAERAFGYRPRMSLAEGLEQMLTEVEKG